MDNPRERTVHLSTAPSSHQTAQKYPEPPTHATVSENQHPNAAQQHPACTPATPAEKQDEIQASSPHPPEGIPQARLPSGAERTTGAPDLVDVDTHPLCEPRARQDLWIRCTPSQRGTARLQAEQNLGGSLQRQTILMLGLGWE